MNIEAADIEKKNVSRGIEGRRKEERVSVMGKKRRCR